MDKQEFKNIQGKIGIITHCLEDKKAYLNVMVGKNKVVTFDITEFEEVEIDSFLKENKIKRIN